MNLAKDLRQDHQNFNTFFSIFPNIGSPEDRQVIGVRFISSDKNPYTDITPKVATLITGTSFQVCKVNQDNSIQSYLVDIGHIAYIEGEDPSIVYLQYNNDITSINVFVNTDVSQDNSYFNDNVIEL